MAKYIITIPGGKFLGCHGGTRCVVVGEYPDALQFAKLNEAIGRCDGIEGARIYTTAGYEDGSDAVHRSTYASVSESPA